MPIQEFTMQLPGFVRTQSVKSFYLTVYLFTNESKFIYKESNAVQPAHSLQLVPNYGINQELSQ
jgi:hypothetical protein